MSPVSITLALLTVGFIAAPWAIEHKAHMALHGLCAQRPSHSYWAGDRRLPFDARMMGIYLGFLSSAVALVAGGGHRRSRDVSARWAALIAALIGVMAVDGLNSLLLDMGLWHAYRPDNLLRVITGTATGIALAVVLCHLVAITVWRTTDRERFVVETPVQLVTLALAPVAPLLIVTSAPGWLYGPISVALIAATLAVVATLALIGIVLLRRLDYTFGSAADLQPLAVQAIGVGIAIMAALSGGRAALERWVGTSPLM